MTWWWNGLRSSLSAWRGDVEIFRGKCEQYILISSGAVYERPLREPYITESTPLNNRHWQYGRDKRACEEAALNAYRAENFPVTIVRPSLTYGDTQIPFAMGSWQHLVVAGAEECSTASPSSSTATARAFEHDAQFRLCKGLCRHHGPQAVHRRSVSHHLGRSADLGRNRHRDRRGRGRSPSWCTSLPTRSSASCPTRRATCSAIRPPAR